jgi:serine/threonine protein kinase
MVASACPDREQLAGYVRGTLPEESFEAVAEHVESCPNCEATVLDLESHPDRVIEQLRTAPPADPFLEEPGCREVMARTKQLGQAAGLAAAAGSREERPALGMIRVYRLLEKLGDGGMGTVYKAQHTELDKVVALKVISQAAVGYLRAGQHQVRQAGQSLDGLRCLQELDLTGTHLSLRSKHVSDAGLVHLKGLTRSRPPASPPCRRRCRSASLSCWKRMQPSSSSSRFDVGFRW